MAPVLRSHTSFVLSDAVIRDAGTTMPLDFFRRQAFTAPRDDVYQAERAQTERSPQ